MKTNPLNLRSLALLALVIFSAGAVLAQTTVVNFDGIDASASPYYVSGAPLANYLLGYGITLAIFAPGTTPWIVDRKLWNPAQPSQGPFVPSSGQNMLYMTGDGGQAPTVNFDLHFSTPYWRVWFTRVELRGEQPYSTSSGILFPAWSVTAFDSQGNALGSVGERMTGTFSDTPARWFDLGAYAEPIAGIRIHGDPQGQAGEWGPILDDLGLSLVPEPTALALIGLGGMCWWGFRRRHHESA